MTVESKINTVNYTADGAKVDFAFNFKTFSTDTIFVFEDGVITSKVVVVTLNADQGTNPGGNANVTPAILAPITVTVQRIENLDQLIEYRTGGRFPSASHEGGLDKLTFIAQQHEEKLNRTLAASIGGDPAVDYTFPPYDAGKAFLWNESTKTIANSAEKFDDIVPDAQAAANAADASFKEFQTHYLGAFAADPTLDNEGNELSINALYWNTTTPTSPYFKKWNGSAWLDTLPSNAINITYSNTVSKIPATQVQAAVDYFASNRGGEFVRMIHDEPKGTQGGPSIADTWNLRKLNMVKSDIHNLVTLNVGASTFLLKAGHYRGSAKSVGYQGDSQLLRLTNIDDTLYFYGDNHFIAAAIGAAVNITLDFEFTITTDKNFKLEHHTQTAKATDGLGVDNFVANRNTYGSIILIRTKIL